MYEFYTEDCLSVGVPASRDWRRDDRPLDPRNIPNFNKENRGFLREEHLEKLKFRVANITDYCDNEETLVVSQQPGNRESVRYIWKSFLVHKNTKYQ